jgi:AraC family transcriptional regulator
VPEHEVKEHSHAGAHMVLATRGLYVTSASGQQREGPVLVYNPPDVIHRDRFAGEGGWFFAISFDAADSRDLFEQIKLPDFALRNHDPLVIKQAFRLLKAAGSREASKLDLEVLTLNVLSGLNAQIPLSPKPPPWLQQAQEMIADLSDEDLGIADIADVIGVHRVYLARQYLRHLGCTPGDDLRRRRVERATQLMMTSDLSLCDIALSCGFCDQSHLNRAFLQQWGLTPSSFTKLSGLKSGFKYPRLN